MEDAKENSLNINDYTNEEIIDMFDINPFIQENVLNTFQRLMTQFSSNLDFTNFLASARNKLLNFLLEEKKIDNEQGKDVINVDKLIGDNTDEDDDDDDDDEDEDDDAEPIHWTKTYSEEEQNINSSNYWEKPKTMSLPDRSHSTRVVTSDGHTLRQRTRVNVLQTRELHAVQGEINPNLKHTILRTVNIDSRFRDIHYLDEENCFPFPTQFRTVVAPPKPNKGSNNKKMVIEDSSSKFSFVISEPLTNVIELELSDIQIARSWYVFSQNYFSNTFWVENLSTTITTRYYIKSGNWVETDNVSIGLFAPPTGTTWGSLNNVAQNSDGSGAITNPLEWSFEMVTHKTVIKNTSGNDITIYFYKEDASILCGKHGGKINHNLGWLLGFRKDSYTIKAGHTITSEGLVDTFGSRYLYIKLKDFNNNRPSYNLIGLTANRDSFKLPKYYNKVTMDVPCEADVGKLIAPANETKNRKCRKGTKANSTYNPIDTLTKAQKYTASSIKQALSNKVDNILTAPNVTDLMAKFPVGDSFQRGIGGTFAGIDPIFGTMHIDNSRIENNTRKYFGPVTIKRLEVELLDEYGNTVDMNNMDWSFSLKARRLYQY